MKCLKLLTLPFYLLVFIFGFLMAAPAAHAAVSKILVVPTETSATIYWNSSSKEPSAVTYGLIAGSLIKAANDPVPVSFHSVTLSPLVPNTTYYFHIVEQKNDQPKLTSTFRTLGSGTQSLGAQLLSFTKNLKLGTTDPEVKELQKILNSNPKTQVALVGPGSPGLETNYFGPATARAVSKFQELYAKEILAPNNLTRGTGSVAGSTRAKLNSLVVASNKSLATTGKPTIQTPVYAPPVSSVGNAGGGGGYSGSSGSGGSSPSASPSYSPTPSPSPSGTPSPSPTPTTPTPSPTPSPSPSPSAPLAGTCSDGTDNDGNGKTDMADFGCFGPNQQEGLSNSVYTMFTPSSDSKIYYVSSSGSDSNDGLSSATPLKTLGKGISMLRDGYPDWVLLKRGETWNDESIYVAGAVYNTGKSGRSASEPFLISSYGSSSDRPLCNNCAIVGGSGWQISNLAITGLHFKYVHGSGSKNENAIQLLSYGANITIEDNYVEQYSFNINIGPNGGIYDGVKFRNNVIVDAHGGGLSSGMIWGGVKNGIIENNVIDHNGWYEDGNPANAATTRNHNNYLYYTGYPLIIRNNIISRGSSHGITMPGGIVDGNLFVQNAIALLTTQDVKINNNVFNDARDIDSSNLRGWGMSLQSPTGEIGNNLFVHQVTGAGGSPIIFEFPISGMDIHDNTAYNWCGSRGCDSYWSTALTIAAGSTGVNKLTNNIFQQADGPLIVSDSDLKQVFTFSGNHYYSGGDGTRWFASPTKGASIAKTGWASYSGESNATYGQANFVDATRTVATYNASLGGAGSVSAFLTEARKMSKGNYRSQYMPTATNAWMKAGYTVTSYSQSGTATTYTITATAGTGGTISPSGSVAAGAGFPKTFTITTNSSYAINTVTVDGVSQGAITSYTFPSVAANHTISVSFTQSTTAKFAVGDRVSATAQLNVRATPSTSGSPLGTQAYGVSGTVVAGPASANGFNWYNINYDSGSDGWSVEDYLQASAVAAPTAPVAPTSFTATAGGSSQINLSWSASTGATFYKLERSTSPTSGFSQIVTVSPTSYADTGLSANTTYYYRIRATNNAGDSVYSATVNATTQAVVSGGSGSTGYASCFDGVDNDGDGTTDMNDFSCFGPNQREATTDPIYTMYTPSSDSKVYYVSSATGSDANTGLDPQHPLATIRYAVGLMRDGYPDWVLLKRGDTWSSETFGMSKSWGASKAGRSASEPFVIGSYGSSATRPLCNDCVFQGNSNEHIGNLAVLGLHMRRIDPTDSTTAFAIYFLSYGENITFEDNLLEQYAFNVHMSANGGVFTNVKFRYNLILDAYNGGYSSGMLLGGTPGLLLEGNVVDHNGWKNPGYPASTFDHNIYGYYAGGPVTVRNNIIARASSHGFTIPGGLVEDNLFLQNPIAMMTAGFATIRNNVINDGADSDTQPRGYGYWGSAKDIELYNNYFIHQVTGSGGTPMFFDSGSNNMSIHDNVVYDWCGSSAPGCTTFNSLYYGTPLYIGGSLTGTNTVSNNIFWLVGGIMYRFESDPSGVFTFSGNHYDTRGDAARFVAAPNSIPLSNWQTFSGETNATYGQPTFVDSTRTAATYNASFGGTNSIDAFLTEARKLSKTNYRAQYTAAAADTWIKAGYAVTGYAAGPTITPTPSPSPSPSPTPTPSPSPSPSPSPTPAPSPSPTPSPSPSPSPVSIPGLLHYYSFDGSANDTAGSANGTLINSPTFATGHSGQALQLSGGSYVDLGYAASLSGAQDFTVSLWVNTSASQGAQPLVLQVDAGSPGYNGGYSLTLTSGWYQRTTFDLSNNGAQFGYEVLRADPKINDGAWHLITATRSGNDGVIYIDGVSSATATGTSKALDSAIKTIIGLNLRDPSSYFTGLIDDVRIYGRALTAQEVQTIYNGSVALGQQPSNKSFFGSIWAAFSNLFR